MYKYIISGINGNTGTLLKDKFLNYETYSNNMQSSDADIFIHLAAKTTGSYTEIIESNIYYLSQIIDFCKTQNIKNIIFFSAISINTHTDLYNTSKLLAEQMLKASGLKVLVLRLPMILTQESNNGILNRIANQLINNEDIILHNANKAFNNFIDINEIYNFINTYTFIKEYERINLASNNDWTLEKVIEFLKIKLDSTSSININRDDFPYFNVCTQKAIKEYSYTPIDNAEKLSNWVKTRKK